MDFIGLIKSNPQLSLVLIVIVLSFITLMITKFVTDQKRLKELREKQKELRKLSKDFSKDIKKMTDINKEMMEISMEMMKHSFRPLIITMIPFLLLFHWLSQLFTPILKGWIWYYIGASIISSLILRKFLDVA